MKEFIVWDDVKEVFFESNTLKEHEYGYVYSHDFDRFKGFPYIGKKDINSKKIYADCSIVEFELKQNHPLELYSKEYGIFKYSIETLSYYIELLNGNTLGFGRWENVKNFKVVDTLQENKLGLIK